MLSKRAQSKQAALRVDPQLMGKVRGKTISKVESETDGTLILVTLGDGSTFRLSSNSRINVG
jgi:hypothetical protein